MNGKYQGPIDFNLGDLKKMENQFTSAKDVANYNEQRQKTIASEEAYEFTINERSRLETIRSQEKEKTETARYIENRKLSIIAIWIAVISLIVALFK